VKSTIVPLALAELREAAAFYSERAGADLGLAFVAEFERVVKMIQQNPLAGTASCTTLRKMPSFESLQ
jgi:plasmid stabilization system protein ParE